MQSWTPRRPSPKIARRLFGVANETVARSHRAHAWSWLTPLAACALTILVAVHSETTPTARLTGPTNGAVFATFMLDAAGSSSQGKYSVNQGDENLEWNVWPHASHPVMALVPVEPQVHLNAESSVKATNR
ncbi:MAG TPA: hypothetical protein VGO67_05710 [Verrucomicrobiae bacterium]